MKKTLVLSLAFMLALMAVPFVSASAAVTLQSPNATITQIGGTFQLIANVTSNGVGGNATNVTFQYADTLTGTVTDIATNYSCGGLADDEGVNQCRATFWWDSSSVSDEDGPFTIYAVAKNNSGSTIATTSRADNEVDNTVPTASITATAGSKIRRGNTLTCAVTATRTITRFEFAPQSSGPYSHIFTSSSQPSVPVFVAGSATSVFTPILGQPPEGINYVRCVVSDGTNSTTSSSVQLIMDQSVKANTDVSGQVAIGVADGTIPSGNQPSIPPMLIFVVGAGAFLLLFNKK